MNGKPETTRERFHRILGERAAAIDSVCLDVYTTKIWQIAVDFAFIAAALTLAILSMTQDSGSTGYMIGSIACIAVAALFICVLRSTCPLSFMQYTAKADGKMYIFRAVSKTRAEFYDGENSVAVDHGEYRSGEPMNPDFIRYDFFADMDADIRIGKADKEIFKGRIEVNGREEKCKIVFKDGQVFRGVIAGVRIKYFDVNDKDAKFAIPDTLRDAAKYFKVPFPKLRGISINDTHPKR